jgi:hypothetical protein
MRGTDLPMIVNGPAGGARRGSRRLHLGEAGQHAPVGVDDRRDQFALLGDQLLPFV